MLFSIKKILVCTDLSERSDVVLRNAETLRKRIGASVDVLFVSDIGLHLNFATKKKNTFHDEFLSDITEEFKTRMDDQISRVKINARTIYKEGDVVTKIEETLTEGSFDLMMIGHSSRPFVQRLLGSVARKILSTVSAATLVIDEDLAFGKAGALVDTSGSIDWMVTSSLDFYRTFKFQNLEFISLVHDHEKEKKDKLQEEINYFLHENENTSVRIETTSDFQVAQHLYQLMKKDKVDLAIMKRNRGLKLKKMVLGSETLRMLELEPMNLLVLPV